MPVSKNPKISDQDTAIAKIYDTLVADLGQGQKAMAGIFSGGNQRLGAAYQGAANQLSGTQTGITNRITSSLRGLGLQEALPDVLNPMNSQFAFDQGQIAKTRGADLGSLSKQGTAYQAIGQLGIGNAQKEKAQTRVSAMEKLQALLADLEAERIQAAAAVEQQRLENQIRLSEARRASSSGGGSGDPLDALRAQQMGLEIQMMEQELMGGGDQEPQEFYGGQRGLHQFLNSPTSYWKGSANPQTRARIENIIKTTGYRQGNKFSSGGREYNIMGKMTPLEIALAGAGNTRSRYINNDALRMALELYYGKGSKLP